jgi:hypothetical protein
LKRDGNVRGYVHGAAVLGCGAEVNLLRHTNGFLIEAVAETVDHAMDKDLAVRKKSDAENDVALDV